MRKTMRKTIKRVVSMMLITTLTMGNMASVIAEDTIEIENNQRCSSEELNCVIQCEEYELQCGKTVVKGDIAEKETLYDLKDGIMSILYDDAEVLNTYYIGDSVVSNDNNIYSAETYNVGAGTINLQDVIMVEDDITLSGSNINCENVILYSENGDVNFYCGAAEINGIIYAPSGTVRLEGSSVGVNGLIIAQNVVVRAGEFNISYNEEISEYVKELDFYEETKQQSLSVIKENEKIILNWSEYNFATDTDIYVRYDENEEFVCVGNSTTDEYVLDEVLFNKCDLKIVSYVLGERIESNMVTIYFDKDGIMHEENIDSDDDLIPDGYEIWDLKTDPNNSDTDNDGIKDGYEVMVLDSEPCKYDSQNDTDGDGIINLEEYQNNTNPWLQDTDFDGITDQLDNFAVEPIVGKSSCVDLNIEKRVGKFDIVNKYLIDGIEHEYVYNTITQETTYSREGDDYIVKYMDNNGNIQSVVTSMTDEDESVQDVVIYDYSKDGCLNSVSNNGVTYKFEYDDNFQMTNSYVNGIELINYEYSNGNISKMELGNGNSESYINDENGKVIEKYSDDQLTATYEYDESANLVKSIDWINNITCEYVYNDSKLSEVKINDNISIVYEYDKNVFSTTIKCDDIIYSQSVEYSEGTCSVKLISSDIYTTTQISGNVYDEEIICNNKVLSSNVYELSEGCETGEEAQQIESMCDIHGNEYKYKYDEKGNIVEIYINGRLTEKFDYNIYGELIKEYNFINQDSREYSYNKRGNLTSVTLTDLVNDSSKIIHSFEYNDEQWSDLLTLVDGKKVTYDGIGNPIVYGENIITWTDQLKIESVTNGEDYFEYKYDANGNRLSKIVNGIETRYISDGNYLLGKEVNGIKLWYIYNDFGKVIGFSTNDESYYFEKDIFNSVKNIIDSDGNIMCTYEYDAWGNLLSIEGDLEIATINDFRYQSYIYDDETGFYYLESRYYDPSNYRFVNADSLFSGTNLFMYCNNNPTNYCDPNGKSPIASVYGSSIIFVSDWGYSGVGYKKVSSNSNGGYFYNTSNGATVYFNCYLWALNQTRNNNNYGNPGDFDGNSSTYLSSYYTVSDVYNCVKKDVTYMGYGFKAASSPSASVSTGQRLIAVRTTTTSSPYYSILGGWDYHFMKKIGSTWTYKGGRGGRIFEISSSYTPSSATWDMAGWDTTNKRWAIGCPRGYTSTIKYFILTY